MARRLAVLMHVRGRPNEEALAFLHNLGIMWFPAPMPEKLGLHEDAGLLLVNAPAVTSQLTELAWGLTNTPELSGLVHYYAAPQPERRGLVL